MKKILKYLILLILILPSIVYANAYSDKIIERYKWIPNDFIIKEKNGVRKYQQLSLMVRDSDKQFVYCVEPGISINKNNSYVGSDTNQYEFAKISEDDWKKINLIAYYGYGYRDAFVNHEDLKWYSVTQYMIWQVMPNGYNIYFTDKLDGKKITKYSKEINEIEDLIDKHNVVPDFGISNLDIKLGEEIRLNDKNNVLSKYKVIVSNKIDAKVDGNDLIVKAKMVGKYNISFEKNDEKYSFPPIIYYDNNNQNVMRVGKYDPVKSNINVNVSGGKLLIKKIDADTKKVIPIKNIKFKIKNLDTNEYLMNGNTDIFETNKDGIIVTSFSILNGKYEIEELDQKIDGYLWNKEAIRFEIDDNTKYVQDNEYGLVYEIKFANKRVKGNAEIIKSGETFDAIDGKIYESTKKLKGVKFGLYAHENIYDENHDLIYKKDNLILEEITDKDGKINFDNLYLGKYYVKELDTLKDYILDNKKYYFELKYKDQYTEEISYKLEINNYLKKGELEFTKTDLVTGDAISKTKVEIYNKNDELIYSGVTDNDGKIYLKNLPVGQYYIIEKLAAPGYKLSQEKQYFTILNNEDVVKTNMTNEKMKVVVPDTLKNNYLGTILESIILLSSGIIIYEKKNY